MKNKTDKPIQFKEIETFDDLQALADQPIFCDFTLHQTPVRLKLEPVTPALGEQLRELGRKATPPFNPLRKDYDLMDPKYQAERDLNARKARALTVYACCPVIARKKPGLTGADQIYQFIQGLKLPENILDLIEAKALIGGMGDVERRANFTLPPDSES